MSSLKQKTELIKDPQNSQKIVSIENHGEPDNSTEKPGHSRLEHEKLEPAGSTTLHAWPHFQYYEMHEELNAELWRNPRLRNFQLKFISAMIYQ